MMEKNRAVIYLNKKTAEEEQDPAVLARYYSDNGAEEILVFDCSDT